MNKNLNLPNLLTLSRIFVIPGIIGTFYLGEPLGNWIAVTLYFFAGITDFFDGYLARSQGLTSKLGAFLDPVADKLMVVSAIIMLVAFDKIEGIHILAAMIIMCREILVSGLREFLADLAISVPVTKLAKWKTALQLIAIGALLLGNASPDWLPANNIGFICLWVSAILTVITGYDYLKTGLKHMD
ncbi:MAG: CDP-diacylglycerol--glycerol-3-phosphate 3-phosphatidyltransferase [Sphingomonadales bacterium]|jgi:cardiolipin synthase